MEQSNLPRNSVAIEDTRAVNRIPLSRDEQANETYLLLSSLDLALGFIASAHCCNDRGRAAQLLTHGEVGVFVRRIVYVCVVVRVTVANRTCSFCEDFARGWVIVITNRAPNKPRICAYLAQK